MTMNFPENLNFARLFIHIASAEAFEPTIYVGNYN